MATLNKSNTFAVGTSARADLVNQNFFELENFIKTQVVARDGSNTYSVAPSLPASDPTDIRHWARTKYCKRRPIQLYYDQDWIVHHPGSPAAGAQVQAGFDWVTFAANAVAWLSFPQPFPTNIHSIHGMYGDSGTGYGYEFNHDTQNPTTTSKYGFQIVNFGRIGFSGWISWIAFGW